MPWCPKCKYEYVEGIKVCPDCKTALVDSLEDIEEELEIEEVETVEEMYNQVEEEADEEPMIRIDIRELISKVQAGEMTEEQFNSIIEQLRKASGRTLEYRYKKDLYEENKSSVLVLLAGGLIGIIVLILNAVGVFNFPFKGFSLILTNVVMGGLFLIFIYSGIKALFKAKKLLPDVEKEAALIKECIDYLKEQNKAGAFKVNDDISFEEESIIVSNLCVEALETKFENLEEGFAFFVSDRYYSEIFEDSDSE